MKNCEFCKTVLGNNVGLEIYHLKSHLGLKEYDQLKLMKEIRKIDKSFKFECHNCKKKFDRSFNYNRHVESTCKNMIEKNLKDKYFETLRAINKYIKPNYPEYKNVMNNFKFIGEELNIPIQTYELNSPDVIRNRELKESYSKECKESFEKDTKNTFLKEAEENRGNKKKRNKLLNLVDPVQFKLTDNMTSFRYYLNNYEKGLYVYKSFEEGNYELTIKEIFKTIWCNKNYPENHNIYVSENESNLCYGYLNGEWVSQVKPYIGQVIISTLDDFINNDLYNFLIKTEHKNKEMCDIVVDKISFDSKLELQEQIKEDFLYILYEHRDMIKQTYDQTNISS
tara:strand:+ start:188 stop:1204 length:1017 start_codon:yes stop_codon:yes gene_type:complete